MIVANDSAVEAVAALSDLGKYVAVDVQSMNTVTETADNSDDDDDDDGTGVRLYQSIYETALRNKVPATVIEDMVRIYSYDVDFQRKVQPGDSFDVFYAGEDEGSTITEKNEVLFASLTVGGETKKYYRFQTPDDARRRLLRRDRQEREEVPGAQTGQQRDHALRLRQPPPSDPRLRQDAHRRRLGHGLRHADFRLRQRRRREVAGREGGYGKYVKLKHNNGYETAYGHMSAFAKGMEVGKRVRQGQVIGFVGSTGQSTGAHVHYEILVNGRFVDPMRIKLPRGRSLEGPLMAGFEKERDRLDAMMSNRDGARAHLRRHRRTAAACSRSAIAEPSRQSSYSARPR